MLLVELLRVNSLMVHRGHIALILLTHLIQSADQVISLLGQVGKLLVQCNFMLSIFDLCIPQMIQLCVQVSESVGGLLVIQLQPFQVVGFSEEVSVHRLSLPLNLR